MDEALYRLAARLGRALKRRDLMIATAESCTGGWIGQAITMVPGSSEWFERGFVTYTYISKREMLGVSPRTLARHGAVSEQVVKEMASGALARSHAQVAVAISGVAGPSGGTPDKPVGTVHVAIDGPGGVRHKHYTFPGARDQVRRLAAHWAMKMVLDAARGGATPGEPAGRQPATEQR